MTATPKTTILLRALVAAMLLVATALIGLPSTAAQAAGHHQVSMSGYAFSPRTLTITAGSTVTWTNQDTAPHDVKTTSGPHSFHSPMLDKGGSWSHTFTSPGTYGYLCTVHPGMTGQLIVKSAAAPKPAATHSHTHQPTEHQHAKTSAAAPPGTPRRSTRPPSPSAGSPTPSAPPSASAPAQTQAAPDPKPAASNAPLRPLLLLTGAVAGVAVLCLLLVGSRSAAARRTEGSGDV
ncbi:cupredoxin family copper-binding protein [Streptomyces sp. NPDC005408]|uniref:cupredoxin domain-containing protein n=1 Tax=Streptomyces sp. NPDC005408 TaxID=3155341 RepID=UPI0033AE0954